MNGRRIRFVGAWVIAVSIAAAPVRAEEAMILPLVINGVSQGEAFAVIAENGDVWIETESLGRGDILLGNRGERVVREGKNLVSLRSLAPELQFEIDPESLELRISADPLVLAITRFGKASARPEGLETPPASGGFLNYRATLVSMEDLRLFADGGWSIGGHLLYSSAYLDPAGDLRRGMTNFVVDQPRTMRRLTFGDSFARTDLLGGGVSLAGITFGREFLLDPYFVRYPSLDLAGSVTTPSTVEIYLNGAMVDRRELLPGRFELDQVSLPSGKGAATVVIRDALGGERTLVRPFYASSMVLEEGLSEYSYSLGFERRNEGLESFDYGDPVALAAHRWGLSKWLTAGFRAEASDEIWSAGGSVATRSLAGELSLHAAASEDVGESGSAFSARYAYLTRRFGASIGWTEASDSYATLSLAAERDRATRRVDVMGSFRHGALDVSVSAATEERRDTGTVRRLDVRGHYPILQRGTLFVSAGAIEADGDRSPELGVGVTWNLGFLRSANFVADRRNETSSVTASVQQNLAREPGWGYRIEGGTTGGEDTSYVRVQRQTRNFLFEVDANPSISSDAVNLAAAGAFAFRGGGAHLMRPAQQSYAIVRVPGLAGVRVYVSNLEAGRTDEKGELVITDLIPYYGNRIRIEDSDVPMNYRVGDTERIIAPPLRGGVVVEFDVAAATSVTGIVKIEAKDGSVRMPATGELRLRAADGTLVVSPLGRGAEFYFEDLEPGAYQAEVVDEVGICTVPVRIGASAVPMQDIGTITCEETAP